MRRIEAEGRNPREHKNISGHIAAEFWNKTTTAAHVANPKKDRNKITAYCNRKDGSNK